jgi:DNA polymerase I-like protein with 3'-5' exonuclease and polymerase domains
MLIQGSSASLLKEKIYALYIYSKEHNIKSKMQMNIHDEISWIKHHTEDMDIFYTFKDIMEEWDDACIPIVAEMAITQTTWAEKKEVS